MRAMSTTVSSTVTSTPETASAPPPAEQPERSLCARLAPWAVLLTAVTAMSGNRVDTDLWGHVVYGREVLRDGVLPQTTTWSFVTDSHRWINHENIAELLQAWTVDHIGPVGLTIGKLLLAVVIVSCMIWSSRGGGAGWLATAIVVVVAADTTEFHWHFRPQALTYTCFAILIATLDWVFRDWRGEWRAWQEMWSGRPVTPPASAVRRLNWLLTLVPLFLVWTNSHGGFAAGAAVMTAYLGLRGIEAWAWWGRAASGVIGRLAATVALVGLATLLNPYGVELHQWLLYSVGTARPEISDWRPLDMFGDPDAFGVWLLLLLGAIGLGFSRRRKDLTQLVILGILLWQGLSHCRHLVFFAILCGCWLAPYVHDVVARVTRDLRASSSGRSQQTQASSRPSWLPAGALLMWMTGVTLSLLPRLSEIPVRRDWYPISAMQYVHDHGLTGRFLVDFNWAQYAIMCFADDPASARESRVAVDGRLRTCYPWETLDIYLDFLIGDGGPDVRNRSPNSLPFEADRALSIGPPDLVLLWREQKHSVETIESYSADWVLLYQDQLAQLWGRRDRYDNPAGDDYIPTWERSISETEQVGSVPWPALPAAATEQPTPRMASR